MKKRQKMLMGVISVLVIIVSLVFGWKNHMQRNLPTQENTVIEIRKSSPWASGSNNFVLVVLDNGNVVLFKPEVDVNNNQRINSEIIGYIKKTDVESIVGMFMDLGDLKTQPVVFDKIYIQVTVTIDDRHMTFAYMPEDPNIPEWLRSPESFISSIMMPP